LPTSSILLILLISFVLPIRKYFKSLLEPL
jgi:hypothetical protein